MILIYAIFVTTIPSFLAAMTIALKCDTQIGGFVKRHATPIQPRGNTQGIFETKLKLPTNYACRAKYRGLSDVVIQPSCGLRSMNMAVATDQGTYAPLITRSPVPFSAIIFAGTPAKVSPDSSKERVTTAFAPMVQLSPMVIGPYSFAPGPI